MEDSALGFGGLGRTEREYIRMHHMQQPTDNQCTSALIKHIKAPVNLVLSLSPSPSIKNTCILDLLQHFKSYCNNILGLH